MENGPWRETGKHCFVVVEAWAQTEKEEEIGYKGESIISEREWKRTECTT